MTKDIKRGLRNPLDEAQVRKAVVALQLFLEKQKNEHTKKELVETTEYLSCIITRKNIPSKSAIKPIQIDIPHSLFDETNEMCLFVKDSDKDRIKKALAVDPVPQLTKVMTVKKLRKNYGQFEDKRTLAGAYDMFLADDRILPYLKAPLGTKFFIKKKQPVAVRVSRNDVSNAIRAISHRTLLHINPGACVNVKVAHFQMDIQAIVENILVAMNNCAAHIPKGWNGIQSIHVKTAQSVSLPIYNALSEFAKLPPVTNKKTLLKRKLEEVDVPVMKKAKKTMEEKEIDEEKSDVKKTEEKSKKATPTKKGTPTKKATPTKNVTPTPTPTKKITPTKVTPSKKATPTKKSPNKK